MASWCWWCLKMVFWREEARTPNGGEHIRRTQSRRTERRTHRTYLLLRSQALRCWNWPLPYKRAQDYETATSLCFWYGAGRTDETGRDHYGYVCVFKYIELILLANRIVRLNQNLVVCYLFVVLHFQSNNEYNCKHQLILLQYTQLMTNHLKFKVNPYWHILENSTHPKIFPKFYFPGDDSENFWKISADGPEMW